jgi:hypothetical protein
MSERRLAFIGALLVLLAGCATGYALVTPGTVAIDGLQVDAAGAWNRAPSQATPSARRGTEVWTRDGLLLNRFMIIPGVPDGEPLFRDREKRAALPAFSADMLPNELEELLRSSITKLYGEGASSVRTKNLRPQRFGDHRGILLDLEIALGAGPDYRGLAGSFIAESELYVLLYVAAVPYYYEKALPEAESMVTSARLAPPQ